TQLSKQGNDDQSNVDKNADNNVDELIKENSIVNPDSRRSGSIDLDEQIKNNKEKINEFINVLITDSNLFELAKKRVGINILNAMRNLKMFPDLFLNDDAMFKLFNYGNECKELIKLYENEHADLVNQIRELL